MKIKTNYFRLMTILKAYFKAVSNRSYRTYLNTLHSYTQRVPGNDTRRYLLYHDILVFIYPSGRKWHLYHLLPTSYLLITWWRREPRQQQSWYWLISPGISRPQHKKMLNHGLTDQKDQCTTLDVTIIGKYSRQCRIDITKDMHVFL